MYRWSVRNDFERQEWRWGQCHVAEIRSSLWSLMGAVGNPLPPACCGPPQAHWQLSVPFVPYAFFILSGAKRRERKIFTLIIVHDLCSWSCLSPRPDVFCYVSQKWPIVFLFSFYSFRRCNIKIASAFRDCLDRQSTYNVTVMRVHATIVAVEKQLMLHIVSAWL
jgi:hypothetical protein